MTHRTADAVCHMNPHRFGGFRRIPALNGAVDAAVLFEDGDNLKCFLILKPEDVIPKLLVGPLEPAVIRCLKHMVMEFPVKPVHQGVVAAARVLLHLLQGAEKVAELAA